MSSTSIEKLLGGMRQLRDPEQGCEWDKKQTKSLIPYLRKSQLIIEAIEKDYDNLKEELGIYSYK